MDRRNFLKLFTSSFVAIATATPSDRCINCEIISDDLFIRFNPPSKWVNVSYNDVKNDQILEVDPDSVEMLATPFYLLAKYSEPCKKMNPNIGIFADEIASWMGNDIKQFHNFYVLEYLSMLQNGRVVDKDSSEPINNEWCKSVIEFDFVGISSFSERVLLRIYSTFHRNRLIIMFLTDSSNGPEDSSNDFHNFINSIELIKK